MSFLLPFSTFVAVHLNYPEILKLIFFSLRSMIILYCDWILYIFISFPLCCLLNKTKTQTFLDRNNKTNNYKQHNIGISRSETNCAPIDLYQTKI